MQDLAGGVGDRKRPNETLTVGKTVWQLAERPRVVGVINVTPDSFSDGGLFLDVQAAIERGVELVAEGADALDIGGESTRPSGRVYGVGQREVPARDELARVLPVIRGLRRRLGVPLSIDTRKAEVAEGALDAGADWVNDVSGGTFDPGMLALCARRGVPVVLMHTRGTPETMQTLTDYAEVGRDVATELAVRTAAAVEAGVAMERIVVDPGLGFAKTAAQSLELLDDFSAVWALGYPVMIGASRKSFLTWREEDGSAGRRAEAEGRSIQSSVPPRERVAQSVAAAVVAARAGAALLRVHDVAETVRALSVLAATGAC
jgi:dihydropteroate synthase